MKMYGSYEKVKMVMFHFYVSLLEGINYFVRKNYISVAESKEDRAEKDTRKK